MTLPAITFHDLRVEWPDGTSPFAGLDAQIPPGRSALVGDNGAGKTTLFRLIAGDLAPARGSVTVSGSVGWLRQDLTLQTATPVDEHLGIAEVRRAIRAVESGDVDPQHFDVIGSDWDIEERAVAELTRLGLPDDVLDRRVGDLSGGESMQLSLAALLLARPDVLLLDEPTNNLDRPARARVHDLVATYRGTLVVISHDRELLELVDRVGDVRSGAEATRSITWYGGGWSSYAEQVAAERAAAEHAVASARSEVRRQQQDLQDAETTIARKARSGRRIQTSGSLAPILAGARKRAAQVSAGTLRGVQEQRLDDARARLAQARDELRGDREIHVDLPATVVHRGQHVVSLDQVELRTGAVLSLDVSGPERIAVTGPNGSGKTTLLRTLIGELAPVSGAVRLSVPARLVPQRLDVLDPEASIVDNARHFAPEADHHEIREQLAKLLFRGRDAEKVVGTLSGGELLRATLACLLLAAPTPRLLVLDEPTNNLDLASTTQLVQALGSYRGSLVVVSHDEAFLDDLGLTRRIEM